MAKKTNMNTKREKYIENLIKESEHRVLNEHEIIQLIGYTEGILGESGFLSSIGNAVNSFNDKLFKNRQLNTVSKATDSGLGRDVRKTAIRKPSKGSKGKRANLPTRSPLTSIGNVSAEDERLLSKIINNTPAMEFLDKWAKTGNEKAKVLLSKLNTLKNSAGQKLQTVGNQVKTQITDPTSNFRQTTSAVAQKAKKVGSLAAKPFTPAVRGTRDMFKAAKNKVVNTLTDPQTYKTLAQNTGKNAVELAKMMKSVLVQYPNIVYKDGALYASKTLNPKDGIKLELPVTNPQTGAKEKVSLLSLTPKEALKYLGYTTKDAFDKLKNMPGVISGMSSDVASNMYPTLSESLNKSLNENWFTDLFRSNPQTQVQQPQYSQQDLMDMYQTQNDLNQIYKNFGLNLTNPEDQIEFLQKDTSTIQDPKLKSIAQEFQDEIFHTLSPRMQQNLISQGRVSSDLASKETQKAQNTVTQFKDPIKMTYDPYNKTSSIQDVELLSKIMGITIPVKGPDGVTYKNGKDMYNALIRKNNQKQKRIQQNKARIKADKDFFNKFNKQRNARANLTGTKDLSSLVQKAYNPSVFTRLGNSLLRMVSPDLRKRDPYELKQDLDTQFKNLGLTSKQDRLAFLNNLKDNTPSIVIGTGPNGDIKISPNDLNALYAAHQISEPVYNNIKRANTSLQNLNRYLQANPSKNTDTITYTKNSLIKSMGVPPKLLSKIVGTNSSKDPRLVKRFSRKTPVVQKPTQKSQVTINGGSTTPISIAQPHLRDGVGVATSESYKNQKPVMSKLTEAMVLSYLQLVEDMGTPTRLSKARKHISSMPSKNQPVTNQKKPGRLAAFNQFNNTTANTNQQHSNWMSRLGVKAGEIGRNVANGWGKVKADYRTSLRQDNVVLSDGRTVRDHIYDLLKGPITQDTLNALAQYQKAGIPLTRNQINILNNATRYNPHMDQLQKKSYMALLNAGYEDPEEANQQVNQTNQSPQVQKPQQPTQPVVNKPTNTTIAKSNGHFVVDNPTSEKLQKNGYTIDTKRNELFYNRISIPLSNVNSFEVTPQGKVLLDGIPAEIKAVDSSNSFGKDNSGNLIHQTSNGPEVIGPIASLQISKIGNNLSIKGASKQLEIPFTSMKQIPINKVTTPQAYSTNGITYGSPSLGQYSLTSETCTYFEFLDKFKESVESSKSEISPRNMYQLYLIGKLNRLL